MLATPHSSALFEATFSWADFLSTHWRKGPTVIRKAFNEVETTRLHCYDLLRRSSQLYRQRSPDVSVEVFPNGRLQFVDVDGYLPLDTEDVDDSYVRRVTAEPGGDFLTVVLYHCQVQSEEIFSSTQSFLQPLVQFEGIPSSALDVDMFTGQYSYTPSGIHFDAATNFSLVLSGTKRMIFWPPNDFAIEERLASRGNMMLATAQFDHRRRNSVILEAEPGDIVYWPAGYWHMAISSGWCTTLNIALYSETMAGKDILNELSSVNVDEVINTPTVPIVLNEMGEVRPSQRVTDSLADLRRRICSAEFERELLVHWLKRVSASGFDLVPPMRKSVPCDESYVVAPRSDCKIYLSRMSSELLIAANGHVISGEDRGWIRRLVTLLNGRTPSSAVDLIAACTNEGHCANDDVLGVLGLLHGMRAVDFQNANKFPDPARNK